MDESDICLCPGGGKEPKRSGFRTLSASFSCRRENVTGGGGFRRELGRKVKI